MGRGGPRWNKRDSRSQIFGKRYSDDDYFENLLSVWTHYGRQPTCSEMDRGPSSIPSGAYVAKWGKWTNALVAFLERVNADTRQENSQAASARENPKAHRISGRHSRPRQVTDDDQREIKLGLRYEVLKRDRFRCVLCGLSPATHLGCVLHVDHLIPWSKGGMTVIENLRSLCATCNLGKSAKLEGAPH